MEVLLPTVNPADRQVLPKICTYADENRYSECGQKLVEFKLVVSYFSLTSWLNIGTYIRAYRAFIHVVCKSKEYDCNAFVSIY